MVRVKGDLTTSEAESLPAAVSRWARETPTASAVTGAGGGYSYGELDRCARMIARRLRHHHGVHPGDRVGVEVVRSVRVIPILLGILRAGAAYVPLDPADPQHRRREKLRDSGCTIVISDLAPQAGESGRAIRPEALTGARVGRALHGGIGRLPRPRDLACLMYTSGSTGTPKAVAIEHRNIWNLATRPSFVDITPDDVILQMAPIAFDASHFEIWAALLNGATVHVAPAGPLDPDEISEVVRIGGVTIAWLTAALFHLQIDADPSAFGSLRVVLAGGDVLSVPHLRRLRDEAPGCRVINGYGPTETTTFATCHELRPEDYDATTIPIGVPIQGAEVLVMSEEGTELADGECGELWIGGAGPHAAIGAALS